MINSKTNGGKAFEACWKNSYAKLPIYYLRLKDAAKWQRGEGSTFTPENPFDSLQYKSPFIWLLELKSTQGTGISFNPKKPYEKPENKKTQVMIKSNQVKELMKAVEVHGVIGGFVVNFRERETKTKCFPNVTYFIHINDFIKFAESNDKSSLSREDCELLGIKVKSKLLKTNYKYDIDGFSLESPKFYLHRGYINKESLIQTRDWINELIR